MKPVDIHPAAKAEAYDHAAYYAARAPALARDFLAELQAAFLRIAEAPTRWPEAQHDTRRLHVRRFPYTVFLGAFHARLAALP